MTPLYAISIILVIQIIGYILLDKLNVGAWKYLMLGILLATYIFILPGYFMPDNPNNEPGCGMPAFGIALAFWIFGCGTTLIAHLTYILIRKSNNIKRKNNQH